MPARTRRWPDGTLRAEWTEVDGKVHGLARKWDRLGQLVEESIFDAGVRRARRAWRHGVLILEEERDEEGRLHGRQRAWRDGGGLESDIRYEHGVHRGAWKG